MIFVLKSTFDKLQEQLKQTEEKLGRVYDRLWILENPYKFNIGERVKIIRNGEPQSGIIINREIQWYQTWAFNSERYKLYELLIGSEKIFHDEKDIIQ